MNIKNLFMWVSKKETDDSIRYNINTIKPLILVFGLILITGFFINETFSYIASVFNDPTRIVMFNNIFYYTALEIVTSGIAFFIIIGLFIINQGSMIIDSISAAISGRRITRRYIRFPFEYEIVIEKPK